ncbi:MAG: relaxase/mobilization nuclease domain-containing protein [Alphaproteobacteria bacterium]
MIIKGKSRTGPEVLGPYLENAEKNERVNVLEIKGTVAEDLIGALIEMDAYAEGTRCEKPLYHGIISPEPPYRLTREQCMEAVDALEAKLGLEGHARAVVMHEKQGREHFHVVWSRIDLENMRAVSDSHNYRKHEEVARDLERRFGHPRVQGAHAERDGVERPDRTPSRAELRQEERTGISGKDVKLEVTAAFRVSDGPEAFRAALEERGYVLAKGDRRDFVIVDHAGGVHSLARRIDGMKAAELREFMAPLGRDSLPTIEQAKEAQLDRVQSVPSAHDLEKWEDALAESAIEKAKDIDEERKRQARDVKESREEMAELEKWEDALAKSAIEKAEHIDAERKRQAGEARESRDEALLEKGYSRGDDYASQATVAQKHHERRQETLDEQAPIERPQRPEDVAPEIEIAETRKTEDFDHKRRQDDEGARQQAQDASYASSQQPTAYDNIEMTETMRERMDRLLNSDDDRDREAEPDDEPDRHREAPGGGRTRSR